jgi:hypothetical protein
MNATQPWRRRAASLAWAVACLTTVGGCATALESTAGSEPLPTEVYPPVGTAAPASCPSTWKAGEPPLLTRAGPLAPDGATLALLCSYPLPSGTLPSGTLPSDPSPSPGQQSPGQQALGPVHELAEPAELVAYLNGLPATRPIPPEPSAEYACMASGGTQHTIVLEYPDRQPAVVQLSSCAIEQGGNIRYGADLRVLTGFFGVPWNE